MQHVLRDSVGTAARRLAWTGCLLVALLGASAATAFDWKTMAGVNTVTVTTTNEDGTPRETTVWLLVLDGYPYLRTGSTRWGANVERDPDVKLHVGDRDFLLRAVRVTDPTLSERLQQGFREKYGWSDALLGLLPGAGTKLFRVDPRPGS
jgi:hypothetical protein